ncbi:MAG TPA: amidohydrolase family protein [Blastocatellia bacterium]|nr:amidohydrolase family protein [Blastocatellia bacterium]
MSSIAPAEETPVVIVADAMVDGAGNDPVMSPTLTIVGGRITAITTGPRSQIPQNSRLIDRAGCTLVPGFIDAHLHLASIPDVARGSPSSAQADLHEHLAGILRAQGSLVGGVTTIRDCGGPGLFNVNLRDAQVANLWVGPRILACGYPLTTTAGHAYFWGGRADDGQTLRRRVRWLFEHHVDFIKVMVTGGMSTPGSNPYGLQYTVDELRPAVNDAHRLGMRVAAHALCTEGVIVAAESGIDTIEHGWTITGRRQDFDHRVVGPVLESGATVSVTAHESLRSLLPSRPNGGNLAELRRRLAPHKALYDAGIPMIVSSDTIGDRDTRFSGFAESIEVFALGMEVRPAQAIAAATGHAARAVGILDQTGTLEVGKAADIAVVEGDVGHDLTALRRIKDVWRDGRQVVENGRIVQFPSIRI